VDSIMTSASSPPRIVQVAFWCWALGAVALVLLGLLIATSTAPGFFRGAGVIFAVAGLGLAFLAGRTRRGDSRFRRAAVALALTLVVLLVLFAILVHGLGWALVAALMLAGAIAATRSSASAWFDAVESRPANG